MTKLEIPDGEYNISISEQLLMHLANLNSNNVANLRNTKNDQLLSLKYGKYPSTIDDSKPFGLEKEDKKNGSFNLKAATTDNQGKILIEGHSAESKEIDCILVYSESTKVFELQRLGYLLRASPNIKTELTTTPVTTQTAPERKTEAPKKKKKLKESSLFQPKQPRSKTPTITSSSSSFTNPNRASSAPVDDKSPIRSTLKSSFPSPLSSSSLAREKIHNTSLGSPERPKKKPNLSGFTSLETPSLSDNLNPEISESLIELTKSPISKPLPPKFKYAVKPTPASTAVLPVMPNPSISETSEDNEEDDDEFGDLADELEKALSGDESFGIIQVDDRDSGNSIDSKVTTGLGVRLDSSRNGTPINLKNLSSRGAFNEDDLSSSEEE